MALIQVTDPNRKNFGWGSRDMNSCASMALTRSRETGGHSFETGKVYKSGFRAFVKFVRDEGIRDLRNVTREHVLAYSDQISTRYESGEINEKTAQNYLSAVNTVIELIRGDTALNVAPVREAGLPSVSDIATESQCNSQQVHDDARSSVSPQLSAQIAIMREFGARIKESCLLNTKSALKEAEETRQITLERGTKGGHIRVVPITNDNQIIALREAAALQVRAQNLTPAHQTLNQHIQACYRELRAHPEYHPHGDRHAYANARYENLTGVKSPVESGVKHGLEHINYISQQLYISTQAARELDFAARMRVSIELGHYRISITNNYLG